MHQPWDKGRGQKVVNEMKAECEVACREFLCCRSDRVCNVLLGRCHMMSHGFCWRHRGRLRGISTRSRLSGRLRGRLGGAPSRTAKEALHRLKRRCLAHYFGSNLGSYWLWMFSDLNMLKSVEFQPILHSLYFMVLVCTCITMSCSTINIYYQYMALEFWFRSFYKKGWINWSRNECDIVWGWALLECARNSGRIPPSGSTQQSLASLSPLACSGQLTDSQTMADRQWQTYWMHPDPEISRICIEWLVWIGMIAESYWKRKHAKAIASCKVIVSSLYPMHPMRPGPCLFGSCRWLEFGTHGFDHCEYHVGSEVFDCAALLDQYLINMWIYVNTRSFPLFKRSRYVQDNAKAQKARLETTRKCWRPEGCTVWNLHSNLHLLIAHHHHHCKKSIHPEPNMYKHVVFKKVRNWLEGFPHLGLILGREAPGTWPKLRNQKVMETTNRWS